MSDKKGYNPPPEDDGYNRPPVPPKCPKLTMPSIDGIELSKEEIEYIRQKRRLKILARLQDKLFHVCFQLTSLWYKYSAEKGAGLSYSTFTHVDEFNVNQQLADLRAEEFLEIREHLYEVVKSMCGEMNKAVRDIANSRALDDIVDQ